MTKSTFDLAPDESTTQALARLGYGHRPNGKSNYSREIYRLSDGKSMGHHTAGSANEWIRSGCPEEEADQ